VTRPIHLEPTAELASRVLLPGDPGRALLLAQALLERPKMFNHNRGLWGYSGRGPDGEPLTVQSTGMGGPSAAIVISELADLGAQRLIRVGTCGSISPDLVLGELLIATHALAGDGTSRALGAGDGTSATPELLADVIAAAGDGARAGIVASTDLFYDERPESEHEWWHAGAVALEMETATLFALARTRGLAAASVLLVTDEILPVRKRIAADALRAGEHRLGDLAVRALARQPEPGVV
jgi:DeoD family purine-nucleoside phosphorylase